MLRAAAGGPTDLKLHSQLNHPTCAVAVFQQLLIFRHSQEEDKKGRELPLPPFPAAVSARS